MPLASQTRRGLLVAALALAASAPALAQPAWPTRPVTIIVPFAAGGSTDVVARMVGEKLSAIWGQNVVVDNRAGAGGNIGAAAAAKAADGHTLLMASGSIFTVNPHLYASLPFDPKKDFVAITNVATGPMVVAVPPNSDVRDLRGLIAKARANPGKVNFGSAGQGSQVHMAAERLAFTTGIDITHIPYKGESAALNDVMAGQIDLIVGNIGAATPLVTGGKLRALAVTSAERAKMLPDVPTVAEALQMPSFVSTPLWYGFVARAGTPPEAIARLESEIRRAAQTTEVRERLVGLGAQLVEIGNDEFAGQLRAEFEKATRLARELGIRND